MFRHYFIFFLCYFCPNCNYLDIFNDNINRLNTVIYFNRWLNDCINSFINFVIG